MNLFCRNIFTLLALASVPALAAAGERINELHMAWGEGKQQDADQHNSQFSLDYNFYLFQRSARSGFSVGTGYTRLTTDAASNTRIDAFSVYPQLTLWPVSPTLRGGYFFVRALGPTYLSKNWLGDREQANHFAFQAQVGVGFRRRLQSDNTVMMQLSWKHFSNANLFSANDGIDIPVVVSFGLGF